MTEPETLGHASLRSFFVVWAGQLVSITGTTMLSFGLQIWVYVETGSVTRLAFVALAGTLPAVLLAPVAGSAIDRVDRRLLMLGADTLGGVTTIALFVAFVTGNLEIWHVYVAAVADSIANTFQEPAWQASIPVLVPRDRLARANGLVQLNQGVSIVLAPALAGALLAFSGLGAVLLADAVTFLAGMGTLAAVRFPRYESEDTGRRSVRNDAAFAWRYLRERSGLFGLLWLYSGVNFMLSMTNVLIIPLIVSFSSEAAAGTILSLAGIGVIVGSLTVSAYGEPKHLMRTIMIGIFAIGVLLIAQGSRPSLWIIGAATLLLLLLNPILNSASLVIWQTKVEEGVQGRVFSFRRMIAQGVSPLAILLAGPLADHGFEPLMAEGGGLADTVGAVIGVGPGRGIGLLYVIAGIGTMALAVLGWSRERLRNIETDLPDVAGRD